MSDYIKSVRRFLGHRPVIQCGASVIVVSKDKRVLLQRRKDNGLWGYHGGAVELDEDVRLAAARELYEETGLSAKSLELFDVFSGPDMHHVYPNGDEVSNIDIVFICREYEGVIRPQTDEVLELKFFALDEIPVDITPPNVRALVAFIRAESER